MKLSYVGLQDKAAFEAHCRMHMNGLYRIALSILRNDADAQDAVQQGLMKAWISRERIRPGHERGYLTRITTDGRFPIYFTAQ